jgi:hypothetical protein
MAFWRERTSSITFGFNPRQAMPVALSAPHLRHGTYTLMEKDRNTCLEI